LEVHELTGQPISSLQREWGASAPRHAAIWFGLEWDREALNRRINARVKAMIAAGWLEETQRLLRVHGSLSRNAAEATGYHELLEHLAGRMDWDHAVERIKIATRQLARRQMKWFRRFPNVHWLPGGVATETHAQTILDRWVH
jgi:tRNA dimethylallyltransferase